MDACIAEVAPPTVFGDASAGSPVSTTTPSNPESARQSRQPSWSNGQWAKHHVSSLVGNKFVVATVRETVQLGRGTPHSRRRLSRSRSRRCREHDIPGRHLVTVKVFFPRGATFGASHVCGKSWGVLGLTSSEAFDAFYTQGTTKLARQIFAFTGDANEALDIAQEAYIRAWSRWTKVSQLDDPQAWVRRVAYNLAKNSPRRRHHLSPFPAPQQVDDTGSGRTATVGTGGSNGFAFSGASSGDHPSLSGRDEPLRDRSPDGRAGRHSQIMALPRESTSRGRTRGTQL